MGFYHISLFPTTTPKCLSWQVNERGVVHTRGRLKAREIVR